MQGHFPYIAKHLKTGHLYTVLMEVEECTNGREGKMYTVYTRDNMLFCRDSEEFNKKFNKVVDNG